MSPPRPDAGDHRPAIEITTDSGIWRLGATLGKTDEGMRVTAELATDPAGTGTLTPVWTTAQPSLAALEETLGWAIPLPAQNLLRPTVPRRGQHAQSARPLPDDVARALARPTRTSLVHVTDQPTYSYGRLLTAEDPVCRWEQGAVRVDLFAGVSADGPVLGYRISELLPGQQPAVLFAGAHDDLPEWDDRHADDAISTVLVRAIRRGLDDTDGTPRQHAFLNRHHQLLAAAASFPPDPPYPPGTRVVVHRDNQALRATGTILAAVEDTTGQAYLWRPDAADLPGHPWRDHPSWALRAGPWHCTPTLATPAPATTGPDGPVVLTLGAVVATIDDPRFHTGTVLR
ncbi:hypothetical protein I6A84_08670, partial [Frankia sp. CNm7]